MHKVYRHIYCEQSQCKNISLKSKICRKGDKKVKHAIGYKQRFMFKFFTQRDSSLSNFMKVIFFSIFPKRSPKTISAINANVSGYKKRTRMLNILHTFTKWRTHVHVKSDCKAKC